MPFNQVCELLLKNKDEIALIIKKKKGNFHLFPLFKDTMHIWRYGQQKLEMPVCI